ncbi:alpha/beta fold hydrolase [Maritimibacter fusiformis]|nr:alpha/beta hydrolase [Maritimibacter fusiformis]
MSAHPPRISGLPTHVTRMGAGVRRALFIHCSMGRAETWAGVQAALLDKLSMTAFDRPGHGQSAPYRGDGGARGLHDITTQIAASLIERRADVIGHSYGGTVALRLAMERPDKVRSLVLIEPVLLAAMRGSADYDSYLRAIADARAALEAGDREAAAARFNDMVSPEAPWAALSPRARAVLASQIHLIAEESDAVTDDVAGLLAPGRIEAVTQPVLLIEGSLSPRLLSGVNAVLAARLPNATRVVVAGAGHMAPLTHPDSVAAEIATFLKL